MAYSIDTSAFLDAWSRHYPPDVFPAIWNQMDDAAAKSGLLYAPDEVLIELGRKDDGAHDWMRARNGMVVGFDHELEVHLKEIMSRYPRLVDSKKGKSLGDPFVVALAKSRNLTVITGENANGNLTSPKIPDVCNDLKIKWIRIIDFFRKEGWVV
jgi:hypothetical protein